MTTRISEEYLMSLVAIVDLVSDEVLEATRRYPRMASRHEAYSVILEEVDEFWDEVRRSEPDRRSMRSELIQIAAMACRALLDLGLVEDDEP